MKLSKIHNSENESNFKKLINSIENGDPISPLDFYNFWSNIQIHKYYSELLKTIAIYPDKFHNIIENFLYFTIPRKNLKSKDLEILKTIFQTKNDSIYEFANAILTLDYNNYFDIWKNTEKLVLYSIFSYPSIIMSDDIFEELALLLDNRKFSYPVLYYSLLFRSPTSLIKEKILPKAFSALENYPTEDNDLLSMITNVETLIPFSSAAIHEYNTLNSINFLFVPNNYTNSLQNLNDSKIAQYNSIYTILDQIFSIIYPDLSPNPAKINQLFNELVNEIINLYENSDSYNFDCEIKTSNLKIWSLFKDCSVQRESSPADFIPSLHQFELVELDNSFLSISFSKTVYRKYPIISSNATNKFQSKINRIPTNKAINLAVIGGANEFMSFLICYVDYILNFKNDKLSVIPILEDNFRFASFLNQNDIWIRNTASELINFILQPFPNVSVNQCNNIFNPKISKQSIIRNLWTKTYSPYILFQRYLSFYISCAKFITNIPIWIVFILDSNHQTYGVPFIDSFIFSRPSFCGYIAYKSCSTDGKFNGEINTVNIDQNGIKINLYNIPLPTDNEYSFSVEDDCLLLSYSKYEELQDFNSNTIETNSKYTINYFEMKNTNKEPFDITLDSILFKNIHKLKLVRLNHPDSGVGLNLPLRHFEPFNYIFND